MIKLKRKKHLAEHKAHIKSSTVHSLSGNKPSFTDYIGAATVMVAFAGINTPSEMISRSKESAEPGTLLTDPPHIVWG
ncbi:hypothetical protein Bca4012_040318 [Brassica carinata]